MRKLLLLATVALLVNILFPKVVSVTKMDAINLDSELGQHTAFKQNSKASDIGSTGV
jgi:hypothetical protein